MNGGFGLLLDGSEEAENKAKSMLHWDVNNGVRKYFYLTAPQNFDFFLHFFFYRFPEDLGREMPTRLRQSSVP